MPSSRYSCIWVFLNRQERSKETRAKIWKPLILDLIVVVVSFYFD